MKTGEEIAAGPQTSSGDSTATASTQDSGAPKLSWFDKIAAPFRAPDDQKGIIALSQGAASAGDSDDEPGEGEDDEPNPDDEKEPKKPETGWTPPQSKEDFDRAVQAETDRRASLNRQRDIKAERARLRDEDPEAHAELEKQEEIEVARAMTIIDTIDGQVMVPLIEKLPEEKRQAVYDSITSLPARTAAIETVIKHFEDEGYKRGLAEGEKKALAKAESNPAIRKAVLRDQRVVEPGKGGTPDLVEGGRAGGAVSGNQAMNSFIRSRAKVLTQ